MPERTLISQSLDPRPRPPLLLHGRKMPRLLHHHNRLLARPNSCHLRRLLNRAVPAHWWQSEINRGVFVPAEVEGRMGREHYGRHME